MKASRTVLLLAAALGAAASTAQADWVPGMPYKMHYPQMPEFILNQGMGVVDGPSNMAGPPPVRVVKFLADDFLCTGTGPVTGIHFWGSYNQCCLPQIQGVPAFNLAICADIPATNSPMGYSMPGEALWSWYGQPQVTGPWANAGEDFIDPNVNQIIGFDIYVWQYSFAIPRDQAFTQQAGTTYWLAISHSPDTNGDGVVDDTDIAMLDDGWRYGWKTSLDNWNDAAVFADVAYPPLYGLGALLPPSGGWQELIDFRYNFMGTNLDLSFVITPEPATLCLFGLGAAALLARRRGKK